MNLKKALLTTSCVTICVIGLLYGVSPRWFCESFLDTSQEPSTDQSHILRADMMLYIGLGCFWLQCAFSEKHRDAGIIVLAVFCGGLATGRILSIIVDGSPSQILNVYLFLELLLVPVCMWILRRGD